jgi:nitroimidazol reductase NimA-like FMN-containing flavoprotein (pyridoxamine 5'-phosphate oxidase superfamily)
MIIALIESHEGQLKMFIHELDEFQCQKILKQATVGRLACAKDNQPYVMPIYFSFDGRHIYGFTTLGQKIEWMRANPKVCLEIDERRSHDQWQSVIVFGRYEELPDDPEFGAARVAAHEVLQERAMWWEPAYVRPNHFDVPHSLTPIFYRIHIETITGRRSTPDREDRVSESIETPEPRHTWLDKIFQRLRLIAKGSPIQ